MKDSNNTINSDVLISVESRGHFVYFVYCDSCFTNPLDI